MVQISPKRVENTMGKEEVARYEVFSKDLICRHIKTKVCVGKVPQYNCKNLQIIGRPLQAAHSDKGRNFSIYFNFLQVKK